MIEKQPAANGKVKVIFQLPAEVAEQSVVVAGDFNNWNESKDQMKLDKKKGVWSKAITLKPGASYQFRYIVDGKEWRNDEQCDRYEANSYFGENGVIEL